MGKMQHIVAYIAGGANGIGKVLAEKILCQGGKVVLADISCNGIKVAESLGDKALFQCTDVRVEKDITASMKCAKEKFGGINVLVNSAAVFGCEHLYDFKNKKSHSVELYRCLFDTNVWGVFNVTRLVIGMMAENKPDSHQQRGVVINLASSLAFDGTPEYVAYSSASAAVAGLTIPLARCFAKVGIRVVGVCPSFVDSTMTATQKAEEKKRWISMMLTPRRYSYCEEIAHLIQACIENPSINGENIRVDVGFRYDQTADGKQEKRKC